MPRIARIAPGGLIYHVFNRAAAKFKMFRTVKDKQAFESALVEARARFPAMRLLGWCIMENHWHLVLWPTSDGGLARFMHWLTLAHAMRWRTSHRTIGWGPLYQGRYKSFAVQDDGHYLTVLRYVERNALRAGLVGRAERWQWGSLYARISIDRQSELTPSTGPLPLPNDWVELVNAPQTKAEEEALRLSIHRGRPFGDERWQRRTAGRLGLQSCFRCPGRPPKPAGPVRGRA